MSVSPMDEVPLLLPNNPLAMPILEGTKTGVLLMQSCDGCHRYQYPPLSESSSRRLVTGLVTQALDH